MVLWISPVTDFWTDNLNSESVGWNMEPSLILPKITERKLHVDKALNLA